RAYVRIRRRDDQVDARPVDDTPEAVDEAGLWLAAHQEVADRRRLLEEEWIVVTSHDDERGIRPLEASNEVVRRSRAGPGDEHAGDHDPDLWRGRGPANRDASVMDAILPGPAREEEDGEISAWVRVAEVRRAQPRSRS